jgi:hypothetical protein
MPTKNSVVQEITITEFILNIELDSFQKIKNMRITSIECQKITVRQVKTQTDSESTLAIGRIAIIDQMMESPAFATIFLIEPHLYAAVVP